jgi:uncharacterized protein with beta-barrel porin domain
MGGHRLTERLLATSSVAALILAGAMHDPARAAVCAIDYAAAPFANGVSNSGAVNCIAADPASPTTINGNIVNTATGTVGPSGNASGAIVVTANATLTGAIVNSGTIIGSTSGSFGAGISIAGSIGSGITNSGTIGLHVPAVVDLTGDAVFLTASAFAGGVTNSGTVAASISATDSAEAFGLQLNLTTFSGDLANSGLISAIADTSTSSAQASAIVLSATTVAGNFVNSGMIAASATGVAASSAIGVNINDGPPILLYGPTGVATGNFSNAGTIVSTATAMAGSANAIGMELSVTTLDGNFANGGTVVATATGTTTATATGVDISTSTLEGLGYTAAGGTTGSFANSGTIVATATATGGSAQAFGVENGATFGNIVGDFNNSGAISATATGSVAQAAAVSQSSGTLGGGFTNSGAITAIANATSAEATGIALSAATMTGAIVNSGTIAARALGAQDTGHAVALKLGATTVQGNLVNTGTIAATLTGAGTGSAVGLSIGGTILGGVTNTGMIAGVAGTNSTGYGIKNDGGALTINQNGGTITGGTGAGGAAILFGVSGDTLNINGGAIVGDIDGPGGLGATLPTVNVQVGSGHTFAYANTMSTMGAVNLDSGTLRLQNSGTSAAGGTVDTVSYTQLAGSTLGIEIGATGGAPPVAGTGSINASGAMTLAGNFTAFELASNFRPSTTYTYTDVLTWGSLSGGFNAVTSNSPLFSASVSQAGNSDTLTVSLLPIGSVSGLDSNGRSMLAALENSGNPTLDLVYTLNASQLSSVATALEGQQHTQDFHFANEDWQDFTTILENRLSGDGGTAGAITTGSYDLGNSFKVAQATVPMASDASPARFGEMPRRWGVWGVGYGHFASASSTAASAPYDESGDGVVFGADTQLTDRLVGGVAVNIAKDKATISGGGSNAISSYSGAAYANYALDPNWYVNGVAGMGWQGYKNVRVIGAPFATVANASYQGQSYRAYGESGYALHPAFLAQQSLKVTPYFGLGYLHTRLGAYTESSSVGLAVQSVDANSLTTDLGARASLVWRVGSAVLHPEIRAAWQHEWLDDSTSVQASFAQAPGSVFTTTGAAFSREAFVGGAGISSDVTQTTRLFIDYDARLSGGYTAQVISGGLRVAF